MTIQGFDLAAKSLNKLVEFCKKLEAPEGIFQYQGDVIQHNKNPSNTV